MRQFGEWKPVRPTASTGIMERAMGIEPTSEAWEASILPLYDARSTYLLARLYINSARKVLAINSLHAGTLRPSGAAWSIMAPVSQRSSLLMSATPITVAPRRPPGPRGIPLVGTSFMASRDATQTLTRWAREYGDIVHYRFFDFRFYLL